MGVDINNRISLRNALADLPTWVSWTGLPDQSQRRARIVWPELDPGVAFPAMEIGLAGTQYSETGNADASSQFRAAGSLTVLIWDAVAESVVDPATLQADADRFGGLVGDLISEYISQEQALPLLLQTITQPATPYVLGTKNTHHAADDDEDGVDDVAAVSVWQGVFTVNWGWR